MAHGWVDLREHSIVTIQDYLRKMWSENETKHSMVPVGTCPQATPDTPRPWAVWWGVHPS